MFKVQVVGKCQVHSMIFSSISVPGRKLKRKREKERFNFRLEREREEEECKTFYLY